ncbi:hypothetical protein ALO45_200098 [Pseudomonas syringae pv. syringae]|nr:hypothetical protein ALO45_200098 [Pseudomonas syringae pv. syringae]
MPPLRRYHGAKLFFNSVDCGFADICSLGNFFDSHVRGSLTFEKLFYRCHFSVLFRFPTALQEGSAALLLAIPCLIRSTRFS